MRELSAFLDKIGAFYEFNEGRYFKINNRRFMIPDQLLPIIRNKLRLTYAGKYLGKTKKHWEPSAILLREVAMQDGVNKAWVNREIAWLFACGRDVFAESILQHVGNYKDGVFFLVMFGDDCLGYGVFETDDTGSHRLRNIYDIGDFLRRERKQIRE